MTRAFACLSATFLLAAGLFASWTAPLDAAEGKPRYVVVSDMTHDDGNSLIRLLHYANEIDLEAIVVTPQEPDNKWDSDRPCAMAQDWRTPKRYFFRHSSIVIGF